MFSIAFSDCSGYANFELFANIQEEGRLGQD